MRWNDRFLTQSINVEALYALLPAAPQLPWRSVAGLCGSTVGPVYRSLQRTLLDDVEQVAALLVDLELQNEADEVRIACAAFALAWDRKLIDITGF